MHSSPEHACICNNFNAQNQKAPEGLRLTVGGAGPLEAEAVAVSAGGCVSGGGQSGAGKGGGPPRLLPAGCRLPGSATNYKTQQYAKESLSPGKGIAHTIN